MKTRQFSSNRHQPYQQPQQHYPSLHERTSKLEDKLEKFMHASLTNQKNIEASLKKPIIKNEISDFFFHSYQHNGREKIYFTYPQNLTTFQKMMETKIDIFTVNKFSYDDSSNPRNKNRVVG